MCVREGVGQVSVCVREGGEEEEGEGREDGGGREERGRGGKEGVGGRREEGGMEGRGGSSQVEIGGERENISSIIDHAHHVVVCTAKY